MKFSALLLSRLPMQAASNWPTLSSRPGQPQINLPSIYQLAETPAEYKGARRNGERTCCPIDLQGEAPRDAGAPTIDDIIANNTRERRMERVRLDLVSDWPLPESRSGFEPSALDVISSARSTSTRRANSSRYRSASATEFRVKACSRSILRVTIQLIPVR